MKSRIHGGLRVHGHIFPHATDIYAGSSSLYGLVNPLQGILCAGSGIRTRTPFRADAFETSMSASSIIPARSATWDRVLSSSTPPRSWMGTIYLVGVGSSA